MSETTETAAPQDGGAPAPEPAAAPAPATEGAAPDTTNDTTDEQAKPSRIDRRLAALTARLSAGEAERARMTAELESYRRQASPQPDRPPTPEDIPRLVAQQVAEKLAQERAQERATGFHDAGRAAYPDWNDRCQALVAMGFDSGLADLLLELPDGSKVAGSLADDPEAAEKIASMKTPTARALALGRYGASLGERAAPTPRAVSRAPAPIRPVAGSSARVEFNEYLEADPNKLAAYYSDQAMAKRRGR